MEDKQMTFEEKTKEYKDHLETLKEIIVWKFTNGLLV